ncbi:AraC family transcriptional regulator [Sphingobacterium sp. JUb56]|uniref:AraC family transcriptional regulator n=1 Tax=Sphingobacterium sp. JUb56 TaxID=2587145 RepID=UPI00161415CE|nr:AraC family transcriptional regulator [Sphingobacterium sp. JUb56]MBB2949576.1 AraC-like DNA-binding protein [Sphingobacterium sp. JUb56]
MKPVFAKVLEGLGSNIFVTREINRPYFSSEFHFHKECQITYIVKSEGRRMIGDSLDTFTSDELTFIGSDLPHVWHNDSQDLNINHAASSMALYFEPDKLISTLSLFFNTSKLEQFFALSQRGLIFHGKLKNDLKSILQKMISSEGIPKTILLLELFQKMLNSQEYSFLSSPGYTNTYIAKDNEKIDKIFRHVFDNFSKEINLEEVSKIANMTKHAFCRYFKTRTQKTFIQFVNEVRISQACKLINEDKNQIGNIAYDCGFNSLSNFNKIFKTTKGITPSEYKNELLK